MEEDRPPHEHTSSGTTQNAVYQMQNGGLSCVRRQGQQGAAQPVDIQGFADAILDTIKNYGGIDEAEQRMLAEDLLKCSLKFFPISNMQPGLVHVLCDEHVQRQPHLMQCTHRLSFKHSCMAISCSDPACALCKNSVDRRCPDNDFFEDKYVRGRDAIGAKCGGPIQISLAEVASGLSCEIDVDLRVIVVNGHLFDREFGVMDGHVRVEHVYEKMHIFANQDLPSLFTCSDKNTMMSREGLLMRMERGVAQLPSSMLLTSSSKTNEDKNRYFRMIVLTSYSAGDSVLAAVSPKLHCISPRFGRDPTRTKTKPHVSDSITVLDDIGPKRRTVLHGFNISKVGDLKRALEKNPESRSFFGRAVVGNLTGAWDKICDAAQHAAEDDDRDRVWHHTHFRAVFNCKQAVIDREGPIEVVQNNGERISPSQISQAAILEIRKMALEDWERPMHPNWDFYEENAQGPQVNGSTVPFEAGTLEVQGPQLYALCVPSDSVVVMKDEWQEMDHQEQ